MARKGDVFWNPASRTALRFVETTAETGGARLVVEWRIAPGERLARRAHWHAGPAGHVAERFEVQEGRAAMRIGEQERSGGPGTAFEVPAGVAHVHPWNTGEGILSLRQTITPPQPDPELTFGVESFFETLTALGQRGSADRDGEIPNRLQMALTIHDLLMPGTWIAGVPRFLQRAALRWLARRAHAQGYAARILPDRRPPPPGFA